MAQPLTSKGFSTTLLVVVVLVIAGLGFGGWLVWRKSQNDTSSKQTKPAARTTSRSNTTTEMKADPYEGWKTYTNEAYGIRFRYPNEWTIAVDKAASMSEGNEPDGIPNHIYTITLAKGSLLKADFSVYDQTLESTVLAYDKYYGKGKSQEIPKTEATFKGMPLTKYADPSNPTDFRIYIVERNNKSYSVGSSGDQESILSDPGYWSKFDKTFDSLEIK